MINLILIIILISFAASSVALYSACEELNTFSLLLHSKLFYFAFIQSHLNYCPIILSSISQHNLIIFLQKMPFFTARGATCNSDRHSSHLLEPQTWAHSHAENCVSNRRTFSAVALLLLSSEIWNCVGKWQGEKAIHSLRLSSALNCKAAPFRPNPCRKPGGGGGVKFA